MIKVTYKIFLVFILTGFNVSSNTIKGTELQRIVENWLQKNDQTANIKILGKLKYPYCGESKLLINDISGNYKLIKVKCIDTNPWQIIVRNKKQKSKKIKLKEFTDTFVLKKNLKSGTVLQKDHLLLIEKKRNGNSVFISNESELIGKKLKRNMNKNIALKYNDIQTDWLIEKDALVTIINNKSNITIKESGIAMESANFMDRLFVKNVKSGKMIQVYAKNKKNVVINPKQF